MYENVKITRDLFGLKKGDIFYNAYFHTFHNVYDFWINPPDYLFCDQDPIRVYKNNYNKNGADS